MLAGTPVILLREGTERRTGREAQRDSLRAARAVAESIRSTLGPRGMDKMLVESSGDIVITNDGATLLREMDIDHPAAKMLAELAKTQDQECGDGTKTCVILAGELLKQAEELLDEHIHPTLITQGYQLAAQKAVEFLRASATPVAKTDDPMLERIAQTAMISKGVAGLRVELARLAVRAVREVMDESGATPRFDRSNIQFVKRQGGDILDSELLDGHILEQEPVHSSMPRLVTGARIALVEGALEARKTEFSAEIRITDPSQVDAFLAEEARLVDAMVKAVQASGANVLFTEKGIDDLAAEHLAKAGIYAVRRAKRKDLELLARASGGRLVARPEEVEPADLGSAERVEDRKIGEDHLTLVTGCPHARAVALLLRGGTEHVLSEVERSMIDAVSVVGVALEEGVVATGAGASAIEVGQRLHEFAQTVHGREQMAVDRFASALEIIPSTLAENAGMDHINTLIELRRRHKAGDRHAGVDVLNQRVADMDQEAVEPVRVGRQAIEGATEAVTMLLRIDDIIAAKRGAAPGAGPGGPGPGPSP